MQFSVNEQGCRQLSADILSQMRGIAQLVSEIDGQNGMLQAALGEDYGAIARSVSVMTAELGSAQQELNTIITDMNEYISRVQQARVSLS